MANRKIKVKPCPACGAHDPELWRALRPHFDKFFFVCARCHYCSKTTFTARMALWKWNHGKRGKKK